MNGYMFITKQRSLPLLYTSRRYSIQLLQNPSILYTLSTSPKRREQPFLTKSLDRCAFFACYADLLHSIYFKMSTPPPPSTLKKHLLAVSLADKEVEILFLYLRKSGSGKYRSIYERRIDVNQDLMTQHSVREDQHYLSPCRQNNLLSKPYQIIYFPQ